MISDRDVNAAIRDLVRESVDLPGEGLDRVLATAMETPQLRRRRWWPLRQDAALVPGVPRTTHIPALTGGNGTAPAGSVNVVGLSTVAKVAGAGALVALVAFFVGTQLSGDDAVIGPAASPSPSPTATASMTPERTASVSPSPDGVTPSLVARPAAMCVPSSGGPAEPCPLTGFADLTSIDRASSTVLPVRTVGAEFEGQGKPFTLLYENEHAELAISGIAESGVFHGDPRFQLGAGFDAIQVGVDTVDGSDCIIMISFVDALSISGGFSCDDHPSEGPESPVDISGAFEASIAERGAASAYRSDSYMAGWDSHMLSYDSALYFDGRLESVTAEFPDGPMQLMFRSDDGSTMEVTGTTSVGTYTEDDGWSIVVDDGDSGFFDLDANNSDCTIEVEEADESSIEADFGCRFLGREVGGSFEAIP